MARSPSSIRGLRLLALLLVLGTTGSRAYGADRPTPPMATARPESLVAHGQVRLDEYYWLRQRDDPEVLAYLAAENAYADSVMAPTAALQETLYQEIAGRIGQADTSAPYRLGDYRYYHRLAAGAEYPVYCRRRIDPPGDEEVLLDVNLLAAEQEYCEVGEVQVSSGQDVLAYAVDGQGRRQYTVHFRDLRTGRILPDRLTGVTDNLVWAEDDRTLFYTRQDSVTLRWDRVYRHRLGTDPAEDPLVYREPDSTYECSVEKTRSRRYLLIASWQTLATEYRFLEADRPEGEFRVIEPRRRGHEYYVDHGSGFFYLRTNDQATNFRLMRAPVATPSRPHWEEVIPSRDEVLLEDHLLFRGFLVVQERRQGLVRLRVRDLGNGEEHYLGFEEPAYLVYPVDNREFDAPSLRYAYTSLTTPRSVYDYDLDRRTRVLVKQDEVLGGFDPAAYRTERLWATAADGAQVPISLVYRVDRFRRDGRNPLLLYGYGAYGISSEPVFRAERLSLLDRGFAYAVAHVRGGQELGRPWYEAGRQTRKRNTFTDFIACAEYLAGAGYADRERLFARGGSAGGLLVGAAVTMRPELFRGVVAEVPFVDVVTTMLDEEIPLTTAEYDEWGNPHEREAYDYILSYSPYDNLRPGPYPDLLITAGLHDSQVQYWEPAKWAARLRARQTGNGRILLKTRMEAGHDGVSGRYRQYREAAYQYAFLLTAAARP
ncbi:MAG: S9 family peptidase [Candidatus Latescibacterota bacterium]